MRDAAEFLREGETCWRVTQAERAALLFDAAGYFGALRASLLAAERSILLAGWDIDSRTPIRGAEPPDDDAPETLGPLLSWLVERRRELVVRILLWDYSVLYALEREPLPRLQLDWKTPRGVEVCLDNQLPFGASHHEKLAVIDGRVAYCGGLDLTIRRWDRPAHAPADPDRVDPDGEAYGPYHDLQLVVDGQAARALGELLVERWNRAARRPARAIEARSDPWPDGVEPGFSDIAIGIARTRPAYRKDTELRQVETAYLDAIRRAERLIYIENQYLTVDGIARALAERLAATPDLELVIVNPENPGGWLEQQTMGQGRNRFLGHLADASIADRVRVLYPWVAGDDGRVAVMVHAKLMIVDDDLLHLGSSNLNRRSMGVDRECDLLLVADGAGQRATISGLRRALIAHHLGIEPDAVEAAAADGTGLIAWLDAREDSERGFARLERVPAAASPASELLIDLADPEQPIDPERFIGDLYGATPAHPLRRHALRILGAMALVAAVLLAWRFTPLGQWAEPERIGALLEQVAASPWSGPVVLACFVLGSFCIFPVTVLIAGTAAALGPGPGFLWAGLGSLLAAAANFGAGRLLHERALENWFGDWVGGIKEKLRNGGLVSIMIVRNVPIAPFSVVNVVAGAARIRFVDYIAGTALGMAPGIAALTILGDRLRGVWENPGWLNVGLLVLAIAIWIGIATGLQHLSNRIADER